MNLIDKRIAVVTGANRGIGLEICRQLSKKGYQVILTSRDEQKGLAVCLQLQDEGLPVQYHQLDVSDPTSINKIREFIDKEYGHCDVLINNAGIFPDSADASGNEWPSVFTSSIDTVRAAMETNVYGPMLLCQALVPLMKKQNYGRIVNLSSGMGQLTHMGGNCPAYRISKTSINALTRVLSEETLEHNILVNSMCPGWVKTAMGGPGATRELPEGADTAVWLAMLPDDGPRGKFFRDRKEFEW
jgi:NAD(P)-dependent dehydrogenase (short-subunit alcohol dehydrogenase family)